MTKKKSIRAVLIFFVVLLIGTSPLIYTSIKYNHLKTKTIRLILKDYKNASTSEKDTYERTTFTVKNKKTINEILEFVKKGKVVESGRYCYKPSVQQFDSLELPSLIIDVNDFSDYTLNIVLNKEDRGYEVHMELSSKEKAKFLKYIDNLKNKLK